MQQKYENPLRVRFHYENWIRFVAQISVLMTVEEWRKALQNALEVLATTSQISVQR